MQEIITRRYQCEKCNVVYDTEKQALACEAKGFTIPEWVKEGQVVKSLLNPDGNVLTGEYRLYPSLGSEHQVQIEIYHKHSGITAFYYPSTFYL